jgi:hypothetical protein
MHEISYAGGTFVTSDEVAEILLEYAAALANADRAASVEVPAAGLPTGEESMQILVGPASQLMSAPIDSDESVTGTEGFVGEMRKRIKELERGWTRPATGSAIDWDL